MNFERTCAGCREFRSGGPPLRLLRGSHRNRLVLDGDMPLRAAHYREPAEKRDGQIRLW